MARVTDRNLRKVFSKYMVKPTEFFGFLLTNFYFLWHIPDFSDKGNSRVRINCIRPQNTVFCDVDKRRSKSKTNGTGIKNVIEVKNVMVVKM